LIISGEAICDGGTIQWQIFSETHGSTETDMSTKTRSAVEDHAQKMMEDSAWAVAEVVRLRIEQSPAPAGFTRAFTVEKNRYRVHKSLFLHFLNFFILFCFIFQKGK